MTTPTIIEQTSASATEAARAKFWRKAVVALSRDELARAIGYSVSAISLFEQGYDANGRPIGARAWRRYRLVCAGLGVANFTWGVSDEASEDDPQPGRPREGQADDARVQARDAP
jgi:hypothetical protein